MHISPPNNSSPAYSYSFRPVLPQGTYYASSYQPPPLRPYQQTHSVMYTSPSHRPPPSASTYLRVPHDQSRGSHQGSNHDSGHISRAGAPVPYNNPDSIQHWAQRVDPGRPRTASSVGSEVQHTRSPSHRSDKSKDRDCRRDKDKSQAGSVKPSSHGSRNDGGSRADGRSTRPDPQPNKLRKGPSTRGASTIRSPSLHPPTFGRR